MTSDNFGDPADDAREESPRAAIEQFKSIARPIDDP